MRTFLTGLTVLLLLALPGHAAETGQQQTIKFNDWALTLDGKRITFERGGVALHALWFFQYGISSWEKTGENAFTAQLFPGRNANAGEFKVDVVLSAEGKLKVSYAPLAGKNAKGPTVLLSFPSLLAGSVVMMNDKESTVPPTCDPQQRFYLGGNGARSYQFFKDVPTKRLGIAVSTCADSTLRDKRAGQEGMDQGSFDFVFYVHPDKQSNQAALELDLSLVKGLGEQAALGVRAGGNDPVMPQYPAGQNMLTNTTFAGGLYAWQFASIGQMVDGGGWRITPEGGRNGGACAEYTSVKGRATPMLASFPVLVEPGKDYTLSFYARCDNPKAQLYVVAQTAEWPVFAGKKFFKPGRQGKDWVRYTLPLKAPGSLMRVNFGDHWNSALPEADGMKIYLDDVQLVAGADAGALPQAPLVCGTKTAAKNDVFFTGEPAPVDVVLYNATAAELPATAKIEVRDVFRRVVQTKDFSATLPANGQAQTTIDLAATGLSGLFSIRVVATAGAFTGEFFGRAVRLAPVDKSLRFRYMYHIEGQPSVEEVQWRQRLGYRGTLSFQIISDPALFPQYEKLGWKHITSLLEADRTVPVELFQQKMTEADWDKLFAWGDERIARFPGMPNWYKSMNEPEIPRRTWTPQEHVRIVKHLHEKVKAISPQAVVLSPEPCSTTTSGRDWLDKFFAAGGNQWIDGLGSHTYRARPESPDLDKDIEQLKLLKKKYGIESKPMYFTEGEGFTTYTVPARNMAPFNGNIDFRLGMLSLDVGPSETAAAALLARTLLVCLKNADDVRSYLTWGDDFECGRPWAMIASANYLLARAGDAEFVTERTVGDQCRSYVFNSPTQGPVAVLWCHDLAVEKLEKEKPLAALSTLGHKLELRDMDGNVFAAQEQGGKLCFPLGSHPVYIGAASGEKLSAEDLTAVLDASQVGKNGVQTVELSTRLAGLNQLQLKLGNLLPRPVSGEWSAAIEGKEAARGSVELPAKGERTVTVPLPGRADALNCVPLTFGFVQKNGGHFGQVLDYRWFGFHRLGNDSTGTGEWWKDIAPIRIASAVAIVNGKAPWGGEGDLSAACWFAYTDQEMLIHLEVKDDVAQFPADSRSFWQNDSVQLYMDLFGDGQQKAGQGYDSNDTTFWIAKVGGQDTIVRDRAPEWQISFVKPGPVSGAKVSIVRQNELTVYDIRLPKDQVSPIALKPGATFNCALVINDADALGTRKQSLTFTKPGTEPHQHPEFWPQAVLLGQ